MYLAKKNRLMLLFLHDENPLWRRVWPESSDALKKSIHGDNGITGIAATTVSGWRKGKTISDSTAMTAFQNVISAIAGVSVQKGQKQKAKPLEQARYDSLTSDQKETIEIVRAFSRAYLDGSTTLKQVANILSMDLNSCRSIVDKNIFGLLPLLPTLYRHKTERSQAEDDAENRGVYKLAIERNGRWLIGALQVRYLLEIEEGLALRCKLTAPDIRFDRKSVPLEYDGFLTLDAGRMFWVFEKRDPDPKDFFYMITDPGNPLQGKRTHCGYYLTTTQKKLSFPVTGNAFLEAVSVPDADAEEEFMWTAPQIIHDQTECRSLNNRLAEIQKFIPEE